MSKLYTPEQWIMEQFLTSKEKQNELVAENYYLKTELEKQKAEESLKNFAIVNLQDEVAIYHRVDHIWASSLRTEESKKYFTIKKVKELIATDDMDLLYKASQIRINDSSYSNDKPLTILEKKFDFVFEYNGIKLGLEYSSYGDKKEIRTDNYDTGEFADFNPISRKKEMRELALLEFQNKLHRLLKELEEVEEIEADKECE